MKTFTKIGVIAYFLSGAMVCAAIGHENITDEEMYKT